MFADPQGEHASSTRFSCHLTQIVVGIYDQGVRFCIQPPGGYEATILLTLTLSLGEGRGQGKQSSRCPNLKTQPG